MCFYIYLDNQDQEDVVVHEELETATEKPMEEKLLDLINENGCSPDKAIIILQAHQKSKEDIDSLSESPQQSTIDDTDEPVEVSSPPAIEASPSHACPLLQDSNTNEHSLSAELDPSLADELDNLIPIAHDTNQITSTGLPTRLNYDSTPSCTLDDTQTPDTNNVPAKGEASLYPSNETKHTSHPIMCTPTAESRIPTQASRRVDLSCDTKSKDESLDTSLPNGSLVAPVLSQPPTSSIKGLLVVTSEEICGIHKSDNTVIVNDHNDASSKSESHAPLLSASTPDIHTVPTPPSSAIPSTDTTNGQLVATSNEKNTINETITNTEPAPTKSSDAMPTLSTEAEWEMEPKIVATESDHGRPPEGSSLFVLPPINFATLRMIQENGDEIVVPS